MKEELLKEIAELVNLTQIGIIKGVEVLQVQAPDIIQQLLTWEVYNHSVYFGIWFFLLISALLLMKSWKNLTKGNPTWNKIEYSPVPIFAWGYMVIMPIVSIANCIHNVMQIAYIQIAPKIFLIKYLQSLL